MLGLFLSCDVKVRIVAGAGSSVDIPLHSLFLFPARILIGGYLTAILGDLDKGQSYVAIVMCLW